MRSASLLRCARIAAAVTAAAALTLPAVPALASSSAASPGGWAAAVEGAQILLSRSVGPPTSVVGVGGSGFGASEGVDIFFDSILLAATQTAGSGTFGPVKITIPASALPGRHTISAKGSSTGRVATAVFTVRTNWAQFRFGHRHSGVNPFENVLGVSNVASLQNKWTLVTGAGVDSSPVVADGAVYIASNDGTLYAVQATTGKPMWTLHTPRPIYSSPAVAHSVVYAGTEGGGPVLFALNASTGKQLWSFSLTNTNTAVPDSPAVANGVVYFGFSDGNIYAFDATLLAACDSP